MGWTPQGGEFVEGPGEDMGRCTSIRGVGTAQVRLKRGVRTQLKQQYGITL